MMRPEAKRNQEPPLRGGRYTLSTLLGQGSTASVYLALDSETHEERAIKILSPAFSMHKDARTRFEREAETMARLHHPNIVTVWDYGLDGDRFFLVMECVTGGTLMERVEATGAILPQQAAAILHRALLGLHYAHTQGVIHRDIKPQNILLTASGMPKLTDFGLARALHFDEEITIPGAVMGTWAYMAPEQRFDSGQVDIRTDIYAAGASLYTILTTREATDLLRRDRTTDPLAGLPEPLAAVIRTATRFQPEERYQSAEEMARALAEVYSTLPPESPEDDATMLFPATSVPIPVAFRTFDHLEQVRDDLSGTRRNRHRAPKGDAKAVKTAPAKAAAPKAVAPSAPAPGAGPRIPAPVKVAPAAPPPQVLPDPSPEIAGWRQARPTPLSVGLGLLVGTAGGLLLLVLLGALLRMLAAAPAPG